VGELGERRRGSRKRDRGSEAGSRRPWAGCFSRLPESSSLFLFSAGTGRRWAAKVWDAKVWDRCGVLVVMVWNVERGNTTASPIVKIEERC
jgi:hypothetical protein